MNRTSDPTSSDSCAVSLSLSADPPDGSAASAPRAPYQPPRLEPLGAWRALTLQQSIPIGPGSFGAHPDGPTWLA